MNSTFKTECKFNHCHSLHQYCSGSCHHPIPPGPLLYPLSGLLKPAFEPVLSILCDSTELLFFQHLSQIMPGICPLPAPWWTEWTPPLTIQIRLNQGTTNSKHSRAETYTFQGVDRSPWALHLMLRLFKWYLLACHPHHSPTSPLHKFLNKNSWNEWLIIRQSSCFPLFLILQVVIERIWVWELTRQSLKVSYLSFINSTDSIPTSHSFMRLNGIKYTKCLAIVSFH